MTKTGISHGELQSVVDRVENLNAQKEGLGADIAAVFAEAKANGFDTKILKRIIAERKLSNAEREERDAMVELYMSALGMLAATPLGRAAMSRDGIAAAA